MKEIGGYLELEEFSGNEYYPDLIKLNLGRTALLYALEQLNVRKLWLPYFLCDSVTSVCKKWNCEIFWYKTCADFSPDLEKQMMEGEYLYLVNYYGQFDPKKIADFKLKYGNVILDNTHAFFQKPVSGITTLYSVRKFFGLPDGAYLYLPDIKQQPSHIPQDISGERMTHILGRYEHTASRYYKAMLESAHGFYDEPVKQMSRLTHNLLKGIDYASVSEKRSHNYEVLEAALGAENKLNLTAQKGPFVYPFYCRNGAELRKKLASEKIYVPVYWGNVIENSDSSSLEYDYASNILPLPCDQRYTGEDMKYMADIIKTQMKGPENAL